MVETKLETINLHTKVEEELLLLFQLFTIHTKNEWISVNIHELATCINRNIKSINQKTKSLADKGLIFLNKMNDQISIKFNLNDDRNYFYLVTNFSSSLSNLELITDLKDIIFSLEQEIINLQEDVQIDRNQNREIDNLFALISKEVLEELADRITADRTLETVNKTLPKLVYDEIIALREWIGDYETGGIE